MEDGAKEVARVRSWRGLRGLDSMKITMATIYGALNDSLTH